MPKSKSMSLRALPFILTLLVVAAVALDWFLPFNFHAIMGDDLQAILSSQNGGFGSSFLQAFTHAPASKYRPFFDIAFRAETLWLGSDLLSYIYLNIFVELLNAALLFYICWRVSRKSCSIAFLGTLLFIISRFSLYNIVQIFGASLEGLGLFLLLSMLCLIVVAYQNKKVELLVAATVIYFCLTLTHERYLAASAFLFLAILWAPVSFRRASHRYLLLIAPFFAFVFNVLLKKVVFKASFLEGTAGTSIAFKPIQFLQFFMDGWLNLFGFNVGPDYLSGIHVLDTGVTGIGLGCTFSVLIVAVVAFAYRQGKYRESEFEGVSGCKYILLLAVLVASLVAVASITIRQEYRWLYSPYAVFLVLVCYLVGKIRTKALKLTLIISLVLSSLSLELFYRQFLGRHYLVTTLITTDSAKRVMVDNGMKIHPGKKVFFFRARDNEKWAFQVDGFFKYYSGNPTAHVSYINDESEIPVDALAKGDVVIYALDSTREVIDVTEQAKISFGLN